MIAETPTLVPAIQAVTGYAERNQGTLSPEHREILLEIRRRLERAGAQAAELIDINNRMWAKQGFNVEFDPSTDTIILSVGGMEQRLTLKRADPNVPIQMRRLTAGSGYHAGTSQPTDEDEQKLRFE